MKKFNSSSFLMIISALPVILIALFYLTAVLVYHIIGRHPVPLVDDPKYMHIPVWLSVYLGMLSLIAGAVVLWSFPIWLASYIDSWNHKRYRVRSVVLYLVGWLLMITLFNLDPYRYIHWLLD